jgi:AraC-like DNA-binding protein/tetratricopeptide (TPR) repeat protein
MTSDRQLPPAGALHSPAGGLQPRAVRRAMDAMHANVGHRWTISELAAIAGTSGRTLQRQFLTFLGKTPRDVLRDLGFERARRELLQGASGLKVMDVAARCGFPHFGRFAIDYRRRFGETPSQTLKRQATFAATLASMSPLFVPPRDRLLLAFAGIEAEPDQSEAARHIAADLSTALTRAGMAVVREPHLARYQLSGAVRGSGAQTRLLFRLVESETGRQLWAHRTDGLVCGDPAAEENLATRIAAALQPCLRTAEIEHALGKPRDELSPHDLALRAMPGVLAFDAEGNARALDLLEQAIAADPQQALAVALTAWAHLQRVVYHFTPEPAASRARGIELTHKAMTLPGDATVLAVLGNALTLLGELDAAGQVIARALAADGGSAWAWSRSGFIDVYRGDPDSAIERFKIALDLAPHDTLAFNSHVGIGCAHFLAGHYAEAARWQEQGLSLRPSAFWVHRTMCPAYVQAGAMDEARRSAGLLRQRYPDLTVSQLRLGMPPLPSAYGESIVGALSEAGLPA